MSKVYVLIEGYETVIGVFSEAGKEIADSYSEHNGDIDIQEFELDTIQKPLPDGYSGYCVFMSSDFVVNSKYTRRASIDEVITHESEHQDGSLKVSGYTGDYIVMCFAADMEHAMKIASQKVVRAIREEETAESA